MQNIFSTSSAFTMAALTQAINILPNNYGRIEKLGLMPDKGVTTRTILVEEQNGKLNLLPTQPVGSPGTLGRVGKRKMRSFVIPHIPHDDVVLPQEVDSVRPFGSDTGEQAVSKVINDKLQTMKNKHDITKEFLRMGALKGIILDADGSTLYNLYSEFGISPQSIDFGLSNSSTNVDSKCRDLMRYIEDNLLGEVMTNVHALVSKGFFDALVTHPKVKEAYMYFQRQQNLGGDYRTGFTFGGVTFEEYRGQASDPSGNVMKFIADDEGHAFPLGTAETFQTLYAPADFNETVNTIGIPYYSKQAPRKFERGTDLHTQSNPLPICYRPGVLVKLLKG